MHRFVKTARKIALSPPVLTGFGSGIGFGLVLVLLFGIVIIHDYLFTQPSPPSAAYQSPNSSPVTKSEKKESQKLELTVYIKSKGSSLSDAKSKLEDIIEKVKGVFKSKSLEIEPKISYFNVYPTDENGGYYDDEKMEEFSGSVHLKFLIDYPHPRLDDLSEELSTMSGVSSLNLNDPRN